MIVLTGHLKETMLQNVMYIHHIVGYWILVSVSDNDLLIQYSVNLKVFLV